MAHSLILLSLLLPLVADAGPVAGPRVPGFALPSPKAADDVAARRRTQAFEQGLAENEALTGDIRSSDELMRMLQEATRDVGSRPGFWSRLGFPRAHSPESESRHARAQQQLREADRLAVQSAAQASSAIAAVSRLAARTSVTEGRRALLDRQQATMAERLTRVRDQLETVKSRLAELQPGFWNRLWVYVRQLTWTDAPTELASVREELIEWGADRAVPVMGAELTYVEGAVGASRPVAGTATPAYALTAVTLPVLEDTTQGREVEFSPEVRGRASALAGPKAAYEFVKNELRLEWYRGCLKGSTETLREGGGNDSDLASLLIALLRAQGVPARYVRGTIELSVAKLASLSGFLSAAEADAFDAATASTPFAPKPEVRDRVLALLNAGGIPFEPVIAGGQVIALRMGHVWVEAYLGFADYRGVSGGEEGKQWIPLDPAIPGSAKYASVPPVVDAVAGMSLDTGQLTAQYLVSDGALSPRAFYRARVESYLASASPGATFQEALRRVVQRREDLDFLPGSLPYRVVSVESEEAFLPDEAKHRLHISAADGQGSLLDAVVPMHQLAGHRSVFTYRPATDEDLLLVELAGGLYHAPASVVNVVPVLRVDGRDRVVGTRGVGLGSEHGWTVELLLPGGGTRRVDNRIVAGNLVAVGIGAARNAYVEPTAEDADDTDGFAPRFLYQQAAAYANVWTDAEEELAGLLQVIPVRPTANLVLVQYQLRVEQVLGVRTRVAWTGLEMDADLRTMTPIELQAARGRMLLHLAGYEGAYQEARILAGATQSEAVSATGAIQAAHAAGVSVLTITPSNAATELPRLAATAEVLREVEDLVARGREIVIPATSLTIRDWTGTGFIARDPATEEGGYFLSGLLSGGQTVVSPAYWTDPALIERLGQPGAPKSTSDLTRVARIVLIPATNYQAGTVDQPLKMPLAVLVTTAQGTPVRGAPVVFRAEGSAQPLVGNANGAGGYAGEFQTTTDDAGMAVASARPDAITGHYYVLRVAKPNEQRVGLNYVRAETRSGAAAIVARDPFTFLGLPDVPAALPSRPPMDASGAYVGSCTGGIQCAPLQVAVTDRFGNPIANKEVNFSQAPAHGAFFDCNAWSTAARELSPTDPGQQPSWKATTDTNGQACAAYIPGDSGVQKVTATAGALSDAWTLLSTAPREELILSGTHLPESGLVGLSWPSPFGLQARDALGVLTGREARLKSLDLWVRVYDPAGRILYEEHAIPKSVSSLPNDDETRAVFWPRYVQEGPMEAVFGADVVYTDGYTWKPTATLGGLAGVRASAMALRSPLAGVQFPATGCSPASTGDPRVGFSIDDSSIHPVYVRVIQQPTVSGETLVRVPPPERWPRHPSDPGLIALDAYTVSGLWLDLVAGNHGGMVTARVVAFDPATGLKTDLTETTVAVMPTGEALTAEGKLLAKVTLPVRNFESAATPIPPALAPPSATEPVFVEPPVLQFCANAEGIVRVESGGVPIAEGALVSGPSGLFVVATNPDLPAPAKGSDGFLRVKVPPGDTAGQEVVITLQRASSAGAPPELRIVHLDTRIVDAGAMPVGHTFVKGVSVVDGHLARQAEDLSVPGRGPPLSLVRSYTNRGREETALGWGWTHSFHSYVIENRDPAAARYLVVGGEGTGQAFRCAPDSTACTPQRGFHGRLEVRIVQEPDGPKPLVVFRSKSGTEYEYELVESINSVSRHRLRAIRDARGNALKLQYGDASLDGQLESVSSQSRTLFFRYRRPPGSTHQQLACAELVPGNAAVEYTYDPLGNLASASRHDGSCGRIEAAGRTESYSYLSSTDPLLSNNLESYTDPNGNTTRYAYYGQGDSLPGESAFRLFGDRGERVRRVTEPTTPTPAVTEFDYSLVQEPLASGGTGVATRVTGPRPGVPPTVYRLNPYGATAEVERPVNPSEVAVKYTRWDPVHIRPVLEQDPIGRQTSFAYDERGNLIERRVATSLPAGAQDSLEAVKRDGVEVSATIERWAYDPLYGGETCHVDPEGRVSVTSYELGLPKVRTGFATLLTAAQVSAEGTCDVVAAQVASSTRDQLVERTYCTTDTCSLPTGAWRGDLMSTVEHGRGTDQGLRRVVVGEYDPSGLPRVTTTDPGGAGVVTTTVFDVRGRPTDQSDSLGHHTATSFDSLDRPWRIDRFNTLGGSPGERRTLTYYDSGALRTEQVESAGGGGGLVLRSVEIDGMGRPTVVTEKDLMSGVTLTSAVEYDEDGNKAVVTDRRGVRTRTVFDYGDRPVETWVSVRSIELPRFEADGGDVTRFDLEQRVSRAGFDVAGNKVWESDRHGHQTDYTLDTLYRVVRVTQPQTDDESGAPVRYQVARAYDLVGNRVLESDGNANTTRYVYDFGNRATVITDALGRSVNRDYDGTGALRVEKSLAGGVEQVRRELTYDGLGRPLDTTETWAVSGGTRSRFSSARYDDAAHRVLLRDVRGVVTVRKLDGLDRVYSETSDTTDGLLARTFTGAPAVAAESLFEYDAMGHRTAMVDALGRRTDEHVDASGRVTSRVRPMGVTETFRYDGEGQLVERQDGRGVHWKTYRDPLGRVTKESVIEADAGELALKRSQYIDEVTPLVHELDARGNLTTRTLDALHREVKVVDAEGGVVETRHDAVNRRWVSDPRKFETWLSYDAVNRPTGQEDHPPSGGLLYAQTTTYRDALREEEHVSRAGLTTLTTRDGLGRTVRIERSGTGDDGTRLSAADSSDLDAAGNVTLKTDANGHAARYEFDGLGRKVAETIADGTAVAARTSSTYDKVGNRTEVKGPRGTWAYDLHQDYDDLDRPVRTVDATGSVTTTAFDAGGNKVCELRPSGGDPLGIGGAAGKSVDALQALACGKPASTAFSYDERSKLRSVTSAAGTTTFLYDEAGNLVAKQDANAHLTTYAYDRANRRTDEWQQLDAQARLTSRSQVAALQRTVVPDVGFTTGTLHWQVAYDAAGNATQVTEPKGDVRVSTYGALNRLDTITFTTHDKPLGVLVPTSTTTAYDGDGKVKTVTQVKSVWRTFFDVDSTVTEVTSSEHDGLGRLWREHRYDGKVVEYAHDLKGNRKKVTDPDGVETAYDYDAADRLATVTTPRGAATSTTWPDGLRKSTSLPNGLAEGRCYDQAGRLTAIVTRAGAVADTCPDTLQDQSRFRYGYDANGNRLTQLEWRTDPATQVLGAVEETTYGYDAIDRLVGVQYPGGKAELYRLDPVGNRTGERELSGATLSAAELTSLDPPAGATLVRDVTGTFNRADWLLSLADAKDTARNVALGWTASGELLTKTTATVSRQLTWDGRGALVTVTDNGIEVGRYDYDADGLRVKRRTAAENVEYVLDDTHVLQETDATILEHPSYRRYHYGAEPLMVVDGATARFIGTDALGSPTDLTGTTGQVEAKRQYDAWGQYRNGTAPGAGEAKLGFTGHQFDPETGLVYARARYYDPEIGRFISRDTYEGTLPDAPSLHRFAYSAFNPLRYTDATGNVYDDLLPEERKQIQQANQERRADLEARCSGGNGGVCDQIRQEDIQAAVMVGPTAVVSGAALLSVLVPAGSAAATGVVAKLAPPVKGAIAGTLGFLARHGQRAADWLQTALGCVDSQSVGGCAVSVITHGARERAYRSGTASRPPGQQTVEEAPAAPNTARVNDEVPGGQAGGSLATGNTQGPAALARSAPGPVRRSLGAAAADDPALVAAGGSPHAPGDVVDEAIIVRGGTKPMPKPGEVFSGAQGSTLEEAGTGVPHGTIRHTTAGTIRERGGSIEVAPEPTREGNVNYRHVNVCEAGDASCFSEPIPNPAPAKDRIR